MLGNLFKIMNYITNDNVVYRNISMLCIFYKKEVEENFIFSSKVRDDLQLIKNKENLSFGLGKVLH